MRYRNTIGSLCSQGVNKLHTTRIHLPVFSRSQQTTKNGRLLNKIPWLGSVLDTLLAFLRRQARTMVLL